MFGTIRRVQPFWLAVLSIVVLAGCSGDSRSPMAPSLPGAGGPGLGSPSSGATVHGRVNRAGGVVTSPSFAPAAEVSGDATPDLTVEVIGTGLRANVGANGEFMITGLDAVADVVLRVSGPDVAGRAQTIALGASLGEDDVLEVELSLDDGGNVRLDSVELDHNSPDDDSSHDDDSADDESVDDDESLDDDSADDESVDDDFADDVSDDDSDDQSDDDASDDTSDDESDDDSSDDER